MKEDAVIAVELSDLDLCEVAAGGSAKAGAGQACGALRKGAALCDSLGLGNDAKPTGGKAKRSRKK